MNKINLNIVKVTIFFFFQKNAVKSFESFIFENKNIF